MKIKIINAGYGIGSCKAEDIPEWVTKFGKAKDVTMFYCYDQDWIVLNKDHVNYENYKMIVEKYLSFDDEERRYINTIAHVSSKKIYKLLRILNYIIRVRRKLYKSMIIKECEKHETN